MRKHVLDVRDGQTLAMGIRPSSSEGVNEGRIFLGVPIYLGVLAIDHVLSELGQREDPETQANMREINGRTAPLRFASDAPTSKRDPGSRITTARAPA